MILHHKDRIRELGGDGSGNWGHAGRPGERGGSAAGGGGGFSSSDLKSAMIKYAESKGVKVDPALKGETSTGVTASLDSDRGHMDIPRTDAENAALGYYKGMGFVSINNALYGNTPLDNPNSKEAMLHIKALDDVTTKNTIDGGTTYSGLGVRGGNMFDGVDEGDSIMMKGFISTTTDKKAGDFYTTHFDTNHEIIEHKVLVFEHDKGTKGFFMGSKNNEKELLLPRDNTYKVSKIVEEGGIKYYHLKNIGR